MQLSSLARFTIKQRCDTNWNFAFSFFCLVAHVIARSTRQTVIIFFVRQKWRWRANERKYFFCCWLYFLLLGVRWGKKRYSFNVYFRFILSVQLKQNDVSSESKTYIHKQQAHLIDSFTWSTSVTFKDIKKISNRIVCVTRARQKQNLFLKKICSSNSKYKYVFLYTKFFILRYPFSSSFHSFIFVISESNKRKFHIRILMIDLHKHWHTTWTTMRRNIKKTQFFLKFIL